MARTGVTFEDIAQAATKLLSLGESPSVLKVREVLGTGSNSTIADHLKRWKEDRSTRQHITLPETLPTTLIPPLETLWHIALEHADHRYVAHRESTTEQIQQLTTERDTWSAHVQLLENTVHTLKTELKQSHESVTQHKDQQHTLQKAYDALVNENDSLQTTISTLEQQLAQTKHDHQQQLLVFQAQHEQECVQWETRLTDLKHELAKNHQRAEATETRWLRLLDQTRDEIKALKKQHDKALTEQKQALQQQQERCQTLQSQLLDAHRQETRHQAIIEVQNERLEALQNALRFHKKTQDRPREHRKNQRQN